MNLPIEIHKGKLFHNKLPNKEYIQQILDKRNSSSIDILDTGKNDFKFIYQEIKKLHTKTNKIVAT